MALVSEKNNNICLEDLNLKYGIKIVKSALVKSMKEALDFTRISGFPVALKIESQDILHKTDIGGVVLNINSEEELKDSYNMINRSVKKNKPDAIIQGMIVQEMLKEGFELIIGYNNDSTYGPTLMLGMGGIFTEAIKDVVFRLLPIKPKDALEMIGSLKFSDILFKGFRNIPRVSRDMMADLICKVAEMALSIGKKIDSFDINPVIVWSDQYRVVDFKAVYSEKNKVLTTQIANTANLDIFFNSKNLALVGASDSKDKIGGLVLDSLIKNGYKGKIYPINPKYGSVMGLKAYKSVMDIPDQIDLAVFTISLARIPDILNDFDKKNIKNAVIISAGGKEIGETGIEEKIKEIAEVKEIRVIGPNCLGMFGGKSMIDTLFQPHEHMKRPDSGLISLISQSGTVGIAFLELLDGYGVSKFISYGNRIDVDEGDLIEYLAEDPLTRVISVYIEGLEKGRKFFNAVKKAAKIKPVIVYKAGRTPQASKAALSHTGFLTGTHNLIKGVMDQAGVIQEDSIEKLLATAKAL
ncbi:MAG: acetate--CoA ligase family protein, partial [Actinobacteria bacterium]|nr:acetate--CoA ligase family protein [Actinomycetota bacterium]